MNELENKKNKNLKLIIIILIIVILSLGTILLYTMFIKDNNSTVKEEVSETESINNDINSENTEEEINVNLEIISFDNLTINTDAPNNVLNITGKMNLTYEEGKNYVINISGYCLDENENKYFIYGPGSGAVSFYKEDKEFTLVNTINSNNGDAILKDGTKKSASEIDWTNVKISYCKVDNLYIYDTDTDKEENKEINFEKYFNE